MPDWQKRIKALNDAAMFGPPCPKCGSRLRKDGWCEDCGEDMVSTAIKDSMSEAEYKKKVWENKVWEPTAAGLTPAQIEKAMGLAPGSLPPTPPMPPMTPGFGLDEPMIGFDLAPAFRKKPTPPAQPARPKAPSVEEKIDQAPRRAKLELD